MKRTFADTLTALSDYFPAQLVSAGEFNKLISIGAHFPSLISMGAAFETRLSNPQPRLDLFLAINRENRQILAGRQPAADLDQFLFSHPVWCQVRQFCRTWEDSDTPLNKYLKQIFLEFDVGDTVSAIPVPAVFLQLCDTFYLKNPNRPQDGFKDRSDLDTRWLFGMLEMLKNGPVSPAAAANTQKCFNNLLNGTVIDHIAIMSSRTLDNIRVNITGLDPDRLEHYLFDIGLGSRGAEISEVLSELFPLVDHLVLALDVSDTFSGRIGVELRFPKNQVSLYHHTQWESLLDKLVAAGLCGADKREGLLNWGGKSRELFDPELYQFMIFRYLNLVKLVFEPGLAPSAKAYFSFIIQPFDSE